MGFGLLFIGYVFEYVLGMSGVGRLGPFVYLIGYALLYAGTDRLQRYCHSMRRVKWPLLALLITGAYKTVVGLGDVFGFTLVFVTEGVTAWVLTLDLALTLLLHVFLALSVRQLATRAQLPRQAVYAVRNLVLFVLYVVAWCVYELFGYQPSYLWGTVLLLQLLWSVLNSVLLYSCYMRICPAEVIEAERRPSRFAFINQLRAAFDQREQKAREADRTYRAEQAKARQDKQMARLSKKQRAAMEQRLRNQKK